MAQGIEASDKPTQAQKASAGPAARPQMRPPAVWLPLWKPTAPKAVSGAGGRWSPPGNARADSRNSLPQTRRLVVSTPSELEVLARVTRRCRAAAGGRAKAAKRRRSRNLALVMPQTLPLAQRMLSSRVAPRCTECPSRLGHVHPSELSRR